MLEGFFEATLLMASVPVVALLIFIVIGLSKWLSGDDEPFEGF